MAKYINAEKLKAEIQRRMNINLAEKERSECKELWDGAATEDWDLLAYIDGMTQDAPTPPGIEEESQRKGWLDYGLMMSEIGLHRYNANHRIRENKEAVEQIKREIAPAHLARLCEYSEAVGAEITCMCLQRYGMDFIFTQDEVKEIIEKEANQ